MQRGAARFNNCEKTFYKPDRFRDFRGFRGLRRFRDFRISNFTTARRTQNMLLNIKKLFCHSEIITTFAAILAQPSFPIGKLHYTQIIIISLTNKFLFMKKFYAFAAAAVAALSMNAAPLYLCGAGMLQGTEAVALGWAPETPAEVQPQEDGSYVFDINDLTALKISTVMGPWEQWNTANYYADITKESLGTPVALELNASAPNIMGPWKGDYHIVVAADLSTITMTTETEEPTGYTKVYLRGGWDKDWAALEQWEMSTEDGITYTFDCQGETVIPAGVEFKIADADWGSINYSAGGPVTLDEECEWNYDDPTNSTVAADFDGTITMILPEVAREAAIVTFASGVHTGVEAIETVEGEAEYFNLQGVRVANPENGLYIVRQGSKVSKQVIR